MTKGFLRFLRRNTIALLALFLALGGTTYAASTALIGKNTVASPQVVNGSLKTKDLSKSARTALKGNRGLRGLRGLAGPKGPTGSQGLKGDKGDTGAPGSALAYALVNADGTIDAANSKNITQANVIKPAATTGGYCIEGLSFTPHSAVATIRYPGPGQIATGFPPNVGSICSASVQVRILTWNAAGGAAADTPFFIVLN
jgi:Collagen triple helix repeat (20 copies)